MVCYHQNVGLMAFGPTSSSLFMSFHYVNWNSVVEKF